MSWKTKDKKLLAIGLVLLGSIWFLDIVSKNQQVIAHLCVSLSLVWAGRKLYPPF